MGRPSFAPTDEQRAEVRRLRQAKVSIDEIAHRLDVAPKTLRKFFGVELGIISIETVNTALAGSKPRIEAFRPTDEQRESALILAGARWPHQDIADYLRVTLEMLHEHFADDLAMGPKKFPAEVIKASWFAARAGNQTAAKICLIMNGTGEQDPTSQPAREGLKGKKEAAAIAARTAEAGTAWDDADVTGKPN